MTTNFRRCGRGLCLAVALASAGAPARADDTAQYAPKELQLDRYCLRGSVDAAIELHGALNYDKAGAGNGAMLYPAPGVVGLLAAIATHAAVVNTVRDAEKQVLRDEADKFLLPHRGTLASYLQNELMQSSLAAMRTRGDKRIIAAQASSAPGETVIDSAPAFFMTQDQRAIVLENAVTIRTGGNAKPYQKVIRVVSPVRPATAGGAWFDAGAALLKAESAKMYAQSIDIAVSDMKMVGENSNPFKTVRYDEGGSERMERAQLMVEHCEHLVVRTLRGDVMAVPRRTPAPEGVCSAVL